jgi:5'(3')-deoxyribonucleotidase
MIPPPLYNEHGMYYTYVKDVPKFNPALATKLDTFYNDITSAEADRTTIQSNTAIGWQSLKGQYFSAYMDMRMNIINASELEPSILRELNSQSISK